MMHRKTMKSIAEDVLLQKLTEIADDKTEWDTPTFDAWLKANNYSRKIIDVDFGKLSSTVLEHLFRHFCFTECTFVNCKIPAMDFYHCTFINCRFLSSDNYVTCKNNLILYDNTDDINRHIRGFEEENNNFIKLTNEKAPTIAVVFTPHHGTYYTAMMTTALAKRGINIICIYTDSLVFSDVDPAVPKHPIFNNIHGIDGFLLPGGYDIETNRENYSEREKLEAYFMDLSLKHNIPLLGVCRGHQFVGHHLGAAIDYTDDHIDNQIYILPQKTSLIAKLAEKKFQTQQSKHKIKELFKIGDIISYKSRCAHSQGLFFNDKTDARLKVTAQSLDGLPESLQVGNHIITFQHHHEGMQADSFARANVKMFANMVKNFHANKKEQIVTRSKTTNLFKKRESVDELADTTKVKAARGEDDVPQLRRGH